MNHHGRTHNVKEGNKTGRRVVEIHARMKVSYCAGGPQVREALVQRVLGSTRHMRPYISREVEIMLSAHDE